MEFEWPLTRVFILQSVDSPNTRIDFLTPTSLGAKRAPDLWHSGALKELPLTSSPPAICVMVRFDTFQTQLVAAVAKFAPAVDCWCVYKGWFREWGEAACVLRKANFQEMMEVLKKWKNSA